MSGNKRHRIVIIGAGFGGLWATRTLEQYPVEVLLIDRNNYHTFFPLLYQVAAAELAPEDIIYPVRSIIRGIPNTDFAMAEVTKIDPSGSVLQTDDSVVPFDYLIISTGSISHYFDVQGADKHAFPLKTLEHAVAIRNHILICFEQAAFENDSEKRKGLLTFIIVGGGPTGVEFAGALAELVRGPFVRDYPSIDFREVRIVVVEATDSLLPGMPEKIKTYTLGHLHKKGVDALLNTAVSRISADEVYFHNGSSMPARTVIWTAGVKGDPLIRTWGLDVTGSGRVAVDPTLQITGYPNIYVIGDLADFKEKGKSLPMIAPVAIQQGVAAARNIGRQISGQTPFPFHYKDKGAMATIGRNSAVVRLGVWSFTGLFAWILWLTVHIFYLIGFRNRILVLFNWAIDYFLLERAVRFIFPKRFRCS